MKTRGAFAGGRDRKDRRVEIRKGSGASQANSRESKKSPISNQPKIM